ncbi:MAG: carotenoid oxygenase family protein [Candidatus Obscuribacterales bacterium]|nr:carotenoid oxygenase family protein [Candidatus Obscuribacterales bacterium]
MPTTATRSEKTSTNPFLNLNFAPVQSEQLITELSVSGQIPLELEGRFLRIGPNPLKAPNPKSYHWFMGSGMVHGLRLKDGKAQWYKNNYVLSENVTAALHKKALPTPRKTHGGNVNTNVLSIGGELFALVEAGSLPIKLDADLQSVAYSDFKGTLKHGFTAHPHKDHATGEIHAIAYAFDKKTVDYLVIDKEGRSRTAAQIAVPHQPMIHDMAFTKSFAILLDLPVTFSMTTAISGKFPYVWNRKQQPRIGFIPRKIEDAGKVIWIEAPSCGVYHVMNAYETTDRIILDVVKNSMNFDSEILKREPKQNTLVRWTINLTDGKLVETQLSDYSVEFPRINERLFGQEYNFGYTACLTKDVKFGPLYKHDLSKGTTIVRDLGKGRSAMEPVFVPRNNANTEDDGWLMSYVFDENTNNTDVIILDAQKFQCDPVAVIHLPVRVPYGFHGNWIADSDLQTV